MASGGYNRHTHTHILHYMAYRGFRTCNRRRSREVQTVLADHIARPLLRVSLDGSIGGDSGSNSVSPCVDLNTRIMIKTRRMSRRRALALFHHYRRLPGLVGTAISSGGCSGTYDGRTQATGKIWTCAAEGDEKYIVTIINNKNRNYRQNRGARRNG